VNAILTARAPTALDLDLAELTSTLGEMGLPGYRARQAFAAIHARAAAAWQECTDLPAGLRSRLDAELPVGSGEVVAQAVSTDGTRKRLVRYRGGDEVETVAIPARSPEGARRISVCVSTQVGCAMACTFCATGEMGLMRNLTAGEIVDQVYGFGRDDPEFRPTHVVFMGMGEPLANLKPTIRAIQILSDPSGANISQRRMTVSTSGLVPRIVELQGHDLDVTLAISLHAPTDELRSELMPINRRYPLRELIPVAAEYARATGRRVSYEYVLLRDVNDALPLADTLASILPRRLSHVNLIPYNWTSAGYMPARVEQARAFRDRLVERGVSATIRASRGRDIAAACGQLKVEAGRT
jgi:23S rRNA (adenine2503-C2)-methyltransferase